MVLRLRFLCALLCAFLLALPLPVLAGGESESGKTLADIEDYVEYLIDEDPYFTSGQVLAYINAAIQDVIWQTRCTEETTEVTLTAGVSEYALSGTSWFAITNVSWLDSGATKHKPLLRRGPQAHDRSIGGEQKPAWYYIRAGRLGVFSVEDDAVTGTTAFVTYLPVQDTLTSTQNVPTPASLDQALAFYAAARCFFRDKQWIAYQQMMSMYAQYIRRYRLTIGVPPAELKEQQ